MSLVPDLPLPSSVLNTINHFQPGMEFSVKLSRAAPSTGPRATRLSVARGEENTRGAFYQLGNWEQIGIKLWQGKKRVRVEGGGECRLVKLGSGIGQIRFAFCSSAALSTTGGEDRINTWPPERDFISLLLYAFHSGRRWSQKGGRQAGSHE